LGCAAENLAIAAAAVGQAGTLRFDARDDGSVSFAFGDRRQPEAHLFAAIPKRQSTRSVYDLRPVSQADLAKLIRVSAVPGVDMLMITDRTQINRIRDLVVAGNTAQLNDPAFMRELKAWLRFSPRQALEAGDGLFSATTGNPMLPPWLGSGLIRFALTADHENEKYTRQIASSAGLAVFVAQKDDPEHGYSLDGPASALLCRPRH